MSAVPMCDHCRNKRSYEIGKKSQRYTGAHLKWQVRDCDTVIKIRDPKNDPNEVSLDAVTTAYVNGNYIDRCKYDGDKW